MKKVIHIASAILLISLYSCQKEEFKEVLQQTQDSTQARMSDQPQSEEINTISSEESPYTPDSQPTAKRTDNREMINFMVKEISNGDDEADGGDDSRERE